LGVLLVTGAAAPSAQTAKPVHESYLGADYTYPPLASLDALMAASTIVVEGTVSGSRPYDIMEVIEGRTEARPFTAFAVGQLDWIKPSTPPPGDTVEFVIHSYERDLGDRIVRAVSPGDPTPKLGERYLLFLGPAGRPDVPYRLTPPGPEPGLYWLADHAAESVFLIVGDRVVPSGQSDLSRKLAGASRADLVRQLRAMQQ
jgi:hypothetical protein